MDGTRLMAFNDEFRLTSYSLLDPANDNGVEPITVEFELNDIKRFLPDDLFKAIESHPDIHQARDVFLDTNKQPVLALLNKERRILRFSKDEDFLLQKENIQDFCQHLSFGSDNRAVLNGSLYRISAMKDLNNDVYGLTIRFGRSFSGLASIIKDILFSEASILILGPPGKGKSSLLRDVIRILSENNNVVVVDTSNELCGNGDIPHKSVGIFTRRMMVPNLDSQKHVMIEALQNHTPDVIVVDEIGRSQEVVAASTIKNRGVRLVASAHGTFSAFIRKKELNNRLGGFESFTLSDAEARRGADGELRKTISQRVGQPIFNVIIELNGQNCVTVIKEVDKAVDALKQGKTFEVEKRSLAANDSMNPLKAIIVSMETLGR